MDSVGDRRVMMNKLLVEVQSSSLSSDNGWEDDEQEAVVAAREGHPLAWSGHHHPATAAAGSISNRRRLLSKQLSMKETTREAKWEKRRRQILRRSSMVEVTKEGQAGGEGKGSTAARPERMRCLTDEDLDELRGSFELGFGFDEENGGTNLRDTLPALDFYFAVNRQLSDPKLRTLVVSPTSTLSPAASSSMLSCTPSPRSPHASSASADAWKIFTPGENPQLIKTRLRHWAQVVACSVKHGC